jgi:serine protease Do
VTRARLGVRIQEVTNELAQSFGLQSATGVLVAWVEPGSPAQKAGILGGDVILKYNNETIDSAIKLPRLVASSKPGTQATLEIWRKGARQQVTVTLGELPPETTARKPATMPGARPNTLGIAVSELPPAQRKALGIDYGLVVEDVQGAAAETPIRRGDIIIGVNHERLASLEQFNQLLSQQKPGSSVALLVRRGDDMLYVPIKIRG